MRLGIHASVRRGFLGALEQAQALDCPSVQIFPARPGTDLRMPDAPELEQIERFRKQNGIIWLCVHAVYQPNIASQNEKVLKRSYESLVEEFKVAAGLRAEFFVVHAGSFSPGSNLNEGIRQSADTLRRALKEVPGYTKILIENVGGGQRRIGGRFEELKELLEEIGSPRTGICFDTAHAFAAGFSISSEAGMKECLEDFDRKVGIENLKLFHMNDSGAALGSHNDIHVHPGQGHIGLLPLRMLTQDERFKDVPGIIEVPKSLPETYSQNLKLLRN